MNALTILLMVLSIVIHACRGGGEAADTYTATDEIEVRDVIAEGKVGDPGSDRIDLARDDEAAPEEIPGEVFDLAPDYTEPGASDPPRDLDVETSQEGATEAECVPTEGECTLPTFWERTINVTLDLFNAGNACPDLTGDGIGDNALGKTYLRCLSWVREGFPCLLKFLPAPMPLSPVILQYDGPSIFEHFPETAGTYDLRDFGTGVGLLVVRPVTPDPKETKVYVSPSSYADRGCGDVCEPRVHFQNLRCEWCGSWTHDNMVPSYESEVIDSVEIRLPNNYWLCHEYVVDPSKVEECFDAMFSGDDTKTTPVTLRNLRLRLGGPGRFLSGIIGLEDLGKWWDNLYGTRTGPFFEEMWNEIESAADIDLDKDGESDALTFCLGLDTNKSVEVVGLLPSPEQDPTRPLAHLPVNSGKCRSGVSIEPD